MIIYIIKEVKIIKKLFSLNKKAILILSSLFTVVVLAIPMSPEKFIFFLETETN
jgi:hypothetical protein